MVLEELYIFRHYSRIVEGEPHQHLGVVDSEAVFGHRGCRTFQYCVVLES